MKKHLLFNQSFGTVGSPNQTGETLTRENRVGLMSYLRRTLMLLFAVLVMSMANVGMAWGTSGVITAASTTDLGSGNTPRYVVEQAGVGRLMKNSTGSSAWTVDGGKLQTGSKLFALQTYNAISSIVITGYGTGSNRTFSSMRVGTTTGNYAAASATGSGTMSSTESSQTITITPASNIAANSYVEITLSGNIYIYSVELVYAGGGCGETAQTALTLSPSSGTVCVGAETTFTVSGGSGSGALSVSSSAPSKATASISGSTVTVTGVAAGSATITVTKACDATYAEKTATYSATVAAAPSAAAGVDKTTEPGTGVALAATAAADGCTGVWTIQSGPNTATSQLSSTSSATATFTPTVAGTYTLRWTVTNNTTSCSAYDDMTVKAAVCSISSCGNATLTYAINGGSSGDHATGGTDLISSATASNTTALGASTTVGYTGISMSNLAKKAAAATSACYPTKPNMSGKIGVYNGAAYNSSNYLQFAFTVKTGYTFTPCDIEFTVQPVDVATNFRWEVTDGTNVYGYGTATDVPTGSDGGASVLTGLTSTAEMAAGTYYIRLYPYVNAASKTFRISNNVILKGTTASAAPSTKRIYMKAGAWNNDSPKFFVHSWGSSDSDLQLTALGGCESDVFYADIPSGNNSLIFTRQNPSTSSIIWDGSDLWNRTDNISISTYDLFTFTSWDGGDGKSSFTGGTYSAPTYTISYAANSGSGSMSSQTGIACGTDKATTANAFTRDGYSFTGWKADVDVTVGGSTKTAGTLLDDGVTIEDISSNITLTAQWEEVRYTVSYNVNGGGSVDPTSATQASSGASVTLPTPTWSGYTFDGWYSAGTKIGNGGASYTPTADITLYAHWTDNISGKLFSYIDGHYGDKYKSFDGTWVTADATGKDKTFTNAAGVQFVIDDGCWDKKTGLVSLFAKHKVGTSSMEIIIPTGKIATVKIIYGAYGTDADSYSLTVNGVQQAGPASNKLTDGMTSIDGKTYEVTLTNQTGTLTLSSKGGSGKNLYIVRVSAVITGYVVTYDKGTYGTGTLAAGTKTHGSNFTLSSSDDSFTRDGYVYDGWSTNADGSTKDYNLGGTYSTDAAITLYPHWVASCTAPSALAAATSTAKGITLSVTDANNVNNYEFYVSTSSTAPETGATATHSVSSAKSLTITNLVAGTTYYAWARSKCGESNKSGWTALGGGGTFTTSTVTMTPTLTNVTKNSGAESGIGGSDYTAEFEADDEYSMPDPTVTIGGNAATSGTDYTWSVVGSVGTITIPANKINGNIAITLNSADAAPSSAVISGTYHYFPGDNISLTCTPSGNNGPTTYQWYKGGKSDEDNLIDGATSATYTKNSCAFADAGSYYCKVTCNETSIWANTNSYENYDVKILRLYVNGSKSGEAYGNVDFTKVDGTTATASIALGSGWTYGFNIADGCGHYYGNSGTMTENDCTGWTTNVNGTDCGLTTTNAATYTFTINYSSLEAIVTSVTYPVGNQAADKVIYFDNNVLKWTGSSIYYRIGHSSHSQASQLSLVSGTANLYKMTTTEYNGFSGWHIANATGDVGSGKSIYKTVDGTPITKATAHEGGAVTESAITVTPTTSKGYGADVGVNDNCEFFNYTITSGMKTDRVTISPYSNGTITVNYVDTDEEAATLTSGYADLAHTVILTSITAEAEDGYDASAVTINGNAYAANYVVTGATTIAASFTPHVYTITLNKGDHGASNQSASVAYLDDELTSITHVTSTGYTLTGYYDGSTKVLNADGSFAGTDITGYIEGGVWTKTANATLTAKWEAMTTTLTFDANTSYHGTTGDGGATATYDATALASVTHTTPAAGYQLDGYYTTATGEGTKIVNADGTLVSSTSYTTAGGAWQSALANLTLYARYTDKNYSVTHTFSNASRSSGGTAGASAATHGTDYSVVVAATSGYALPSTITVTIGGSTKTAGTEYTWNQGTGTVTIGGSYITGDIVITITSDVDCPSANSGAVVYKFEVKSNVSDGNICSTQNIAVSLNTTTHLTTLTGGTLQGLVTSSSMNNLAFASGRITYANGGAGVLILTLDCAVKTGDIIRFVNYSSSNGKYNYLRHTSNSTTTNQITLNASTTAGTVQEIVVPSAFNNKEELYIVAGSNTTGISYFEIIRPYVVTLDANTNGGEVGGENTEIHYAASGEEIVLPHAVKADYYFNGWFAASTGGVAVSNPYTPTGTTTLYAQFDDCSSTSGTVYKFQLKTELTNGSLPAGVSGEANIEANVGNYLSSLAGGTMTIHNKNNHIQISDNSNLIIDDNGPYLIVNLDCALAAGDIFKSTTSTRGICVTKTATRNDAYTIPVGTENELRVPAEFVGEKTLYLWRGSGSGNTKISYFEVYRSEGYAVTYDKNGHGTAPDNVTANVVTLSDITVDGWKNTGWTADVAVEVGGESKSAGTILVPGTEVTILAATTFTAQWTQTYLLTYDANGGSGAPSAEYRVAGAAALSSTVPTYSGYRFLGWNTESYGTGTRYAAGASYTMGTSAATLYAEWQEAATLTWEPNLNTAESSIGTKSKSSTNTTRIPTSAMSAISNYGSLTITSAKKEGLTSKIATPASYDAGKYMYVTFTVPANYEFVPSSASVKVQPVGENEHKAVILKLSDASGHSISNTPVKCDGTSGGKTTTVTLSNDGGVAFEGTVTLKIYVYAHADASATSNNCYRMGSPIAISGDINYVCPERATITSPTAPQSIKLYTDQSKTLSVSATAYSTGTLTYQWQKDGVNIVGATSASYTVVGSGLTAGTTYVYTCDVSQTSPDACATVTSPAVTIKAASTDCGYTEFASAVLTSKSAADRVNATLLVNGLADMSSGSCKLNGAGAYFGLQLASGSFEVGDSIEFKIKKNDGTEAYIFATTDTTGLQTTDAIYTATSLTSGDNIIKFIVTSGTMLTKLNTTKKIAIVRRTKNGVLNQNHSVYYVKVKRYACPDIFIFDDAAATHEWSDEDNWIGAAGHGSGLPTSDDRIFINESVIVDTDEAAAAEIHITNGAMVTVEKSITVGDVIIENGSTLNVAKDGETAITVATNSLHLMGGWNSSYTKYDMPRVYIDPLSTLTKVVNTVNLDISVDANNYYPIAVPFRVKVSDVDYANSTLAGASTYGTHYVIKDYDGARRAENGPDQVNNWKVVPQKDEKNNDVYLEPGRGYIMTAVSIPAYGGGVIRFPMSFTNAWTANGEQGTVSAVTKNVVEVVAHTGTAATVNKSNAGWNLLGVPFMSCYATAEVDNKDAVIQGRYDFMTNTWIDGTIRYVNVPSHDFAEYIQKPVDEAVLLPGWCFMVQIGESGNLTFVTAGEAENSSLPIYAPKRENENMPTVTTGIILSGAEASDKTTILVSDKYSAADYEINADLEKLFGNGYTLATYSLSGSTRLAYNAMSKNDATAVIPIGYRAPAEGEYTFSINPRYAENGAFQRVDLIDYEAGTVTNLLYGSYTFESARTQNDTRFALNVVLKPTITTDVETISDEGLEMSGAHKMIIDDKLYIILDGKMYDATGKVVKGGQK